MAGDWIKMRTDIADDPAVIGIALATGLDEDTVVGKLHRLWSWADKHTHNGNARAINFVWIDRFLRVENFAQAMCDQSWLRATADGIHLPRFTRHNGKTAKRRALTAKRTALHRALHSCADSITDTVTKSVPREEKNREEKNKVNQKKERPAKGGVVEWTLDLFPEVLRSERFLTAWLNWNKYRKEIGEPLKPTTCDAQLKTLANLGHDSAIAMIEHTIFKGWKGLREPDASVRGPTKLPPRVRLGDSS